MAEKILTQKIDDVTFTMMKAPGFDNNSQVALFVEGAKEPLVVINVSNRSKDMIFLKPTVTNSIRIKRPDDSAPGASSEKTPTLSDVR